MSYAEKRNGPRKAANFVAVLILHAGFVYVLVSGLGRQAIEVIRGPIQTSIIEEARETPPDLPPPPPRFAPPPPPYIPPPEIVVQQSVSRNAITAVTAVKPPEPQPVATPVREPLRVAAVIDPARSCRQPEYPVASKRMEESGTVVLQFLIGTDGTVVESRVESSSGHVRLDQAALEALSRCRFKAGTVDGVPEQSWARLRYVWKLE